MTPVLVAMFFQSNEDTLPHTWEGKHPSELSALLAVSAYTGPKVVVREWTTGEPVGWASATDHAYVPRKPA